CSLVGIPAIMRLRSAECTPGEADGAFQVAPAGDLEKDEPLPEWVQDLAARLEAETVPAPDRPGGMASWPVAGQAVAVRVPVRRAESLGETVSPGALEALTGLFLSLASGGHQASPGTLPALRGRRDSPAPSPWQPPVRIFPVDPARPFSHMPALIKAQGVSGHEEEVRETIRRLLPRRFDHHLSEDPSGNLILDFGAGTPHRLFVAHMDETGYEVERIGPDGRLGVRKRGGFYDSAVVDRPVWIHVAGGPPVTGVMVRRSAGNREAPFQEPVLVSALPADQLAVEVGVRSAGGAAALGIGVGDPITVRKRFQLLGAHRGMGRAVDDRAGCAALVSALHVLAGEGKAADLDTLSRARITFAWVTREEIGLEGARELSQRMRPDVVFAIDTFVSSDSPLERPWFALAPLGRGAVLRAVDSSNLSPLSLVRTTLNGARAAGIPVQVGVGRRGNDGSVFARYGTPDLPLSWPGRFSHSAVEVIDARDHQALVDLIVWLVRQDAGEPEAAAGSGAESGPR
ncbi:MAG: M28 family peptidase, partial [Acidobacteriota bacterium]